MVKVVEQLVLVEHMAVVLGVLKMIQICSGSVGGAGGVRIIWGSGRSYPSTNTADV